MAVISWYYPPLSKYFVFSLFRALLEGERVGLQDAQRRTSQHQRERIIGTDLTSINSFVNIHT